MVGIRGRGATTSFRFRIYIVVKCGCRSVYEKLEIVLLCIFIRASGVDRRSHRRRATMWYVQKHYKLRIAISIAEANSDVHIECEDEWNENDLRANRRNRLNKYLVDVCIASISFFSNAASYPERRRRQQSGSSTDVQIKTGNEIDNSHTLLSLRFGSVSLENCSEQRTKRRRKNTSKYDAGAMIGELRTKFIQQYKCKK